MAVRATRGLVPEWYTPVEERDEEEGRRVRFKIQTLDQLDLMEVCDEATMLADGSILPNQRGRKMLLHKGLVDWENLKDPEGNSVEFDLKNLGRVPVRILAELAQRILNESALSDEEKKS